MFIPSQSEIEKPPTPPSPLPLGIRRSKSTVEIGGRHQSIVNDDGSIEIVDGPPSDKVKRLTIRRSFNRFSLFVNTGAESFLINNNSNSAENKSPVSGLFRSASLSLKKRQETEAAVEQAIKAEHVIENHPDNKWKADGAQSADISITGNLVKSKYAGTKKFVAYQIFDAVSNVIVYRRYKHFAWMHRIMQKTYPSLCLPPLPNRQVQGRFEQEFIDSRQHALERYLRRLAAHPVLCKSKVFTLFMQCTEPAQWKAGKRLAERDAAKGPNFLNTVSLPPTEDCDANPVTANDSAKTAKFARFCKSMQTHCLSLWDALNGIALAAPSMEHIYLRLAFSMKRLVRGNTRNDDGATTNAEGNWCWKEDCEDCAHLTSFIDQTFMAIRDMAIFWDSNVSYYSLVVYDDSNNIILGQKDLLAASGTVGRLSADYRVNGHGCESLSDHSSTRKRYKQDCKL